MIYCAGMRYNLSISLLFPFLMIVDVTGFHHYYEQFNPSQLLVHSIINYFIHSIVRFMREDYFVN